MNYKEQLLQIIDKVREDFSLLGNFTFSGEGDLNEVAGSFEKVYAAAKEARALIASTLGYVPDEMDFPGCLETGTDTIGTDWKEIEEFLSCAPAYRFANASLYGQYCMKLNHFFIAAQQIDPKPLCDVKQIQLPTERVIDLDQIKKDVQAAGRKVAVVGQFCLPILKCFSRRSYDVLDLSQATFGYAEEDYCVCLGMSHSGPVYGSSGTRQVDMLTRLLGSIEALEVILPDDVARRHLNAILKNENIYSVKVGDDCKLFSMKDGSVYNKKQTILVFEPRPAEFVECEDCGKKVLKSHLVKTGEGALVCGECLNKNYEQCYSCGKWYRKEQMKPGEFMDWVMFCPGCVAQDYDKM